MLYHLWRKILKEDINSIPIDPISKSFDFDIWTVILNYIYIYKLQYINNNEQVTARSTS